MVANDIMTPNPTCCTPDMGLQEVSQYMCDLNVGEIPVVEDLSSRKLLGVVTDRDITCRAVAKGKNPLMLRAEECMTQPVYSVSPETDLNECRELMQRYQVRRLPVVGPSGLVVGIIAQADVARNLSSHEAGEVVQGVSQDVEPNPPSVL